MMILAAIELLARRSRVSCFELVVVIGIAVFVVMVREGSLWGWQIQRRRSYERSAAGRPGVVVTAARRIERDLIELPGPPCPARVRYFHHVLGDGHVFRRHNYTEFLAEPEWQSGAMRITTQEWRGVMDRYYGGRDIEIGDAEFDDQFVIQSNPAETAERYLDSDTRDAIRRLALNGSGPFLFQVRPRQLLVRVSRRVPPGGGLEQFIDDCYALVRRLRGESALQGVRFEPIAVGADAICQVCGTKIEPDRRVLCRKCRTPHHMDCWTYNDGCSTFACGERRSVRA